MGSMILPESDLYLVTGVFFQRGEASIFAGKLERDPRHVHGGYKGILRDRCGASRLEDVKISDSVFSFQKWYLDRDYSIAYLFKPNDRREGEWVGTYESERTGSGISRCILTPKDQEYFQLPAYQEA